MLTGRNAFDGASDIEVLNHVRKAHIIAPRKLNREIPSRLEEITLRALKRDPDDRYQRAGDMRTDLMDYAFKASHVSNASKVAALMRGLFKEDIAAGRSASHKAALPDAEDHRAQAYARRSPDVSIDAALDDEVETLPADGPAALLPDTSFPPEDAVTAVVNMSTDSLAQASAHRATDHHEEIMVSTQSAVNLLQDFLDKSATNHVLPRSTPAQSKQTDAPVAVGFFHGPDPDIEARPVELKYGFNQEEVATTVQEIPSLEQAQNAGIQASQLHAQTPPEPHLISGEEDDIDLEPMSAEMSLPMPEGATYGGSPQTPQDGPLPPAFRPSAPSSAQENGRSDRGGPAIEHSESRVAQNAASQSSSHTAETESEEALVATREDLPPFPAATQPSGHLDASPYSSTSGNLHQVHTKVYPQDSDREAKGDTTRAIERDRTLPVLSDEHLIGKSSARWGAAGRDPNADAPHLPASFSSSRTLAYFIGFLAGLLPSLLVAVLMSRSIEPTIPAIGQALPTKGELIIRTERGVETLLDGNVVGGEYPLALELLPGREYSVRLTKPGTPDYVVPVRLEAGQSMVLMVPRLTPFPLGEEDRTSTSAP